MAMFNFAFEGKGKPAAAQEDMVVATPSDVQHANEISQCSDGAVTIMKAGAVRGLVSAFAMRMAAKGIPSEEITERINAFINSAAIAGDLDKDFVRWLKDNDWYKRLERYYRPDPYPAGECMWAYTCDLMDCARGDLIYAANCANDARKKMTEQERVILDNYDKCRRAYWEAESIRDHYFTAKARAVIHDLLIKYAETFGKLDTELFDFLSKRYEIRPDATGSEVVPVPVL